MNALLLVACLLAAEPDVRGQRPQQPLGVPLPFHPKEGPCLLLAEKPKLEPGEFLATFVNGDTMRLRLGEEMLSMVTPYGTLRIAITDIGQIDLARRISPELQQRIAAAIAKLGSKRYVEREAASADLLRIGAPGYSVLLESARNKDPEVSNRSEVLLGKLRATIPAEQLEDRSDDLVQTADARIAGKLDATTLKCRTRPFGNVTLELAEVRSLVGSVTVPEVASVRGKADPDPGRMDAYQPQVGKVFRFTVTGNTQAGTVWGSDTYTVDSPLAMAAVHAGVLRHGQTGVVRVRIVAAPDGFSGSTRNGVTTSNYGPFGNAYQILPHRP